MLTPEGRLLLFVSPRSVFTCRPVTWELAASLKSPFDVCDHLLHIEDLDSTMLVGTVTDMARLSLCNWVCSLAVSTPLG